VSLNLDDKLERVLARHRELADRLASETAPDAQEIVRLSKEYAELTPVAEKIAEIRKVQEDLAGLDDMVASDDVEMVKLARDEQSQLKARLPGLERDLKVMLLPKDEADARNAILEVRAGAGGEEAALFAAMLVDMYRRYAELHGWRFEALGISETGLGGYKEAGASITGRNVFARLKFESGVHRIQRVPQTEASGRIHTSTATVAVLPEAEEVDVHIEDKDLRIDVFRSSGPGGQSVNTTDSAVRITHLPTGLVVQQQDEKSQHKNKAKALKVLRARLYERQRMEQEAARAAQRKSQVGTGERSERIRTYNFPDGRVTDHRIKLTMHKIDKVFGGDALDEIIDPLIADDEAARLADLQ